MSKRHALGRHRATAVSTNPLESISKAVASNAGSVGRQAAVIAAASGLILTLGVPAQANPAPREATAVPAETLTAERVAVKAVSVPTAKVKNYEIERARLTSTPAPEPEPEPVVVANAVGPTTSAAAAPATRNTHAAAPEAAPAPAAAPAETANAAAPATRSSAAPAAAPTPKRQAAPAPNPQAAPSANRGSVASMALSYEGAPYVWGGSTPSGWDCSGFIQYIYGKAGISLPHNTTAIRTSGKFVRTSNPKPGDLVYQNGGSHAGIYIGGGKIIGAQNPSVGTVIREADSPYGPLMGYYTLVR